MERQRRHKAAHKTSDGKKLFDPGGVYSSAAAVVATSLGEGGDRVIYHFLRFCFSFPGFHISTAVGLY